MKKKYLMVISILILALSITACRQKEDNLNSGKYKVVASNSLLADLVKEIGGDITQVDVLMDVGVDPDSYSPSPKDIDKISVADVVILNGLNLEKKLNDTFNKIDENGKTVISVGDSIDKSLLLKSEENDEIYDPHIWFDVGLWEEAAKVVANGLSEFDEKNKDIYEENLNRYIKELSELDDYIKSRVDEVPKESRSLITAHHAFSYFGRAYGFDVRGLQGISTDAEAGTKDVRELADYIVDRKIKSIFVETSIPRRNLEVLVDACKAKGMDIEIGGELYSDSLGDKGTDAETYIGTFKANIDTIVNGLK